MVGRTRIAGATIVSMDPGVGTLDSGDILIEDGKIAAIGRRVDGWAVTTIDGSGMIAMPGFVNGHLHLWQPALRGVAADWTLDRYFGTVIGSVVTLYEPRDAYIGNLIGALDQLNNGTTTLFDWCHIVNTPEHADAAVDALIESGIRAVFGYGTPMTSFGTKQAHPADARRMRSRRLGSRDALVTMALAIRGTDFAPGTAEDDIRFARELGVMASFHAACAKHGPRAQTIVDLARQNLLGRDINLVHGNFLSEEELRAAASAGTSLSITPEVEMQMGLGLPPTGPALKAGVPLNLGTDVVTGVSTDMFTQMRFLLQTERALQNDLYHKQESMPPKLDVSAHEALEIATIGGARTLGLDDKIGSLAQGKAADIVLLRKSDLNLAAIRDPVAAVVLHAHPGNVDTVLIAGSVVKKAGRLAYTLLPQKLRDLQRSADRLHRLLGSKLS